MNRPEVSIVIRTFNEERYLPSLLESIRSQKESPPYEVIVVDSGSTDETLNIAKLNSCKIVHISRQDFSFGRSLNIGCASAEGLYLVLISGHCVPANFYWLASLTAPLKNKQVDLTYGRQIGGPYTHWSESRIFSKYYPSVSNIPQQSFFCNNANSALTAECWYKYKFDETLTGLEDLHLAKRLVGDGGKVGYTAEASVFHYHHESWSQVKKRFEREAFALQKVCPELVVPRRDLLFYLAAAILGDIKHALRANNKLFNVYSIIFYRVSQYWGTWCGQDKHFHLTRMLRDSYYYPTQARGFPLPVVSNISSHQTSFSPPNHR